MFSSQSPRNAFALLILLPLISANPQCYWPDGTTNTYTACNSTASSGSACCGSNDACTTFGWCLGASGFAYRGGCTEKDWSSPACMSSYCTGVKNQYQFLLSCNGGSYVPGQNLLWCCATNVAGSCCANNFSLPYTLATGLTGRTFMSDLSGANVNATVTTTVTAAAATGTSTSAASQDTNSKSNSTAEASSNSKISVGAIAGASVGCAIGGALLGAAIAFMMLRRRTQNSPAELSAQNGAYYDAPKSYPNRPGEGNFTPDQSSFTPEYTPVRQQYQSPPTVPLSEAPSHTPNYELDGQHR